MSCFPLISVAQDQDLATTVSAFHSALGKDFTTLATGPMLFLRQSPSLSSLTFVHHFGICRGFSFAQRAKMLASHTAVFKVGNQQGPPVQQGTLLNVLWQPGWEGLWGRVDLDTCICTAESFCSSPETVTTFLISYTPIQNKKLKKKMLVSVDLNLCVHSDLFY